MKKLLASALAVSLVISSTAAFAGGPVIDDTAEVVPAAPTSSMGILPIIIIGVALCAALCGDNNDQRLR